MHIPCILKSSSEHRGYEFTKSNFGVHLKPEVFLKGPSHDLISMGILRKTSNFDLQLFLLKDIYLGMLQLFYK